MEERTEIDRTLAEQKVRGPAIGLLVTSGLGALLQIASIGLSLMGTLIPDAGSQYGEAPQIVSFLSGAYGILISVVGIAMAGFLAWAGLKMMRLESWGLALTACIVALVPCVSPCCLIGLPFGIWGLVVINDPTVKQAFR